MDLIRWESPAIQMGDSMSRPIVCQYCGYTVGLRHDDLSEPLLCECVPCFKKHHSLKEIDKQAAMMQDILNKTPEAS
jgi:hypothetical protein